MLLTLRVASIFLILSFAAALPAAAQTQTLNVGSKRFAKSWILGEIVTQVANKVGEAHATHKRGLGNTGLVYAALRAGDIDIYPEYTGTIAQEILKDKTVPPIGQLNQELAPLGLAAGVPFGFSDSYAIAMREDVAAKLGIRTISDLARHPELRPGLSQEFLKRSDGWPGLAAAYHLPFPTPQGIDHGLAYAAIADGPIDFTDAYSTDSGIKKFHLRVLTDDLHYFPDYSAVLLYRSNLPQRLPRTMAALQKLAGTIPAARMIAMNAEVEIDGKSADEVAAEYLSGKTATANTQNQGLLARTFTGDFWQLTGQHLFLVFVSLALSMLVGIPLGIWAARQAAAAPPILTTVGVIQTIPSLALLTFLIPILHQIGRTPTIVALFLYSLLPIVRNTYTGLTDISPALRKSAQALGLPSLARLRLIELPLASRAILAGVKTSAVINVGTATIAAFIGAGGYGERIVSGLAINDNATLLSGAIPAALLALLVQGAFDLLDRWMIPKALRSV